MWGLLPSLLLPTPPSMDPQGLAFALDPDGYWIELVRRSPIFPGDGNYFNFSQVTGRGACPAGRVRWAGGVGGVGEMGGWAGWVGGMGRMDGWVGWVGGMGRWMWRWMGGRMG